MFFIKKIQISIAMLANSNWKAWFKSQKLQNIFHIKCHVQNIWISKKILWICEQYVIFVILHLCPCKNLWNKITKKQIFENQWISEKMIPNDKIITMSKLKVKIMMIKIMSFQVCLKKFKKKKKSNLEMQYMSHYPPCVYKQTWN
jgi:hypothetical protein